MAETRIELGDRAKDKITKQTGIVVAITDWLYGCRRILIQPEKTKDGKAVDNFQIDEPQAELMKKGVIAGRHRAIEPERRHGNRPDAANRPMIPSRT